MEAAMHHYTESGLDNIYLENGYHIYKTPYGEGLSIENTEGLHKAIGRWLISVPKPLNGAEIRFLRLELDTTQRILAALIGTTEQTLRLWEKHRKKPLPGPEGQPGSADRLLRALYAEYIGGDGSVRRGLERLAALDKLDSETVCFTASNKRWKPRTVPCLDDPTH
jgi:putative transcriptional regulator